LASEKKSIDAFEAAIRRELQNASRAEVPDCPAPDVLAAYYDRSLSRGERAGVDSHLMSCARCQSMMAAIARADDTQPSLPARETVRGFLQVARVAAPIAIIGAGIAFMVGMRTRAHHALQVAALASPAAPLQSQFAERAVAPPASAVAEQSAPSVPQSLPAPAAGNLIAHNERLAARKRMGAAAKEMAPQQLARAEAPRVESFSAAAPAPGAPSLLAPGAGEGGAPATVVENQTATISSTTSRAAEVATTAPIMNRVASPDGAIIWQFGSNGVITRSDNGGSWVTLESGVTSNLLAASAPSSDVCWMVGKSAIVLRTLDRGAHWRMVEPPAHEDFTMVTASDSNNATVSASSGNRYVTHDGGVTWSSP
jgi:photosynthesis system II assembly factor YCF48-like protein/putative zinc finger protein